MAVMLLGLYQCILMWGLSTSTTTVHRIVFRCSFIRGRENGSILQLQRVYCQDRRRVRQKTKMKTLTLLTMLTTQGIRIPPLITALRIHNRNVRRSSLKAGGLSSIGSTPMDHGMIVGRGASFVSTKLHQLPPQIHLRSSSIRS